MTRFKKPSFKFSTLAMACFSALALTAVNAQTPPTPPAATPPAAKPSAAAPAAASAAAPATPPAAPGATGRPGADCLIQAANPSAEHHHAVIWWRSPRRWRRSPAACCRCLPGRCATQARASGVQQGPEQQVGSEQQLHAPQRSSSSLRCLPNSAGLFATGTAPD